MPEAEPQNHISWCLKRFANFRAYIDQDHYFSRLKDGKYILNSAVAIRETSVHCDDQAVHMVRCPWSTRWRMYKPPRNDTVRVWMGRSPDSQFKFTAECIPTQLKCLFGVDDAEASITRLPTSVQTFGTAPIHRIAGMVIIDMRPRPSIQPLHDASYCRKSLFAVRTTYIFPMSTIQGAVHLLPLMPQPDSSWLYLRNTINLNLFYLFTMCIIEINALSNYCGDSSKSAQCLLRVS